MKYANKIGYSDVTPYEVVRVVSNKTLEIRRMNAERDPNWKPEFVPGGFFGTVVNQNSQEWIITSDDKAPVIRIRLGKQGWKDANRGRYDIADAPQRFYDYNF